MELNLSMTPSHLTQAMETGTSNDSHARDHINYTGVVGRCRVVDRKFDYLPWANPDNLISLETLMNGIKTCGVFIPVLCTMGALVNVLNCVVFFKLGLRERINFLLFSLAAADFVLNACLFLYTIEYLYTLLMGDFQAYGPFITAVTNSGVSTLYGAVYVSGFLSTLIACERCLCIIHPLKAKKIFKTSSTAVVVCITSATLLGLHYITSEKYKIGCEYIPAFKVSITVYYPSSFYLANTAFVNFLNGVVYGLFLPCFFGMTTTVTTIITAVRLGRALKWRQTSTAAANPTSAGAEDAREIALTRMLVAVSCLFIACTVPNLVLRIMPLFLSEFKLGGRNQNLVLLGVAITYCSAVVNSSMNFFFYFRMGSRFRATLKGICSGTRS